MLWFQPKPLYLRLSSIEIHHRLEQFKETFFYLGLLGGILPPIVPIGYFVTYVGMSVCRQGHVFENSLGSCPAYEEQRAPSPSGQVWSARADKLVPRVHPQHRGQRRPPSHPKVGYAWLVDNRSNSRYDLFEGINRIVRGDENDIILPDPAISHRGHAQIRKSGGHFTSSDIGGRTSVLLNGERLTTPIVLQGSDQITVGDTILAFVTSR